MYARIILFFTFMVAAEASLTCMSLASRKCTRSLWKILRNKDSPISLICEHMKIAHDCLEKIYAEGCIPDKQSEEVMTLMRYFYAVLGSNVFECPYNDTETSDSVWTLRAAKCMQDHEDVLLHCIEGLMGDVLISAVLFPEEKDKETRCKMASLMPECLVRRSEEQCGKHVGKMVRNQLPKLPKVGDCDVEKYLYFLDVQLIDDPTLHGVIQASG